MTLFELIMSNFLTYLSTMFKLEEAVTLLVVIMIFLLLEQIKSAETSDFILLRNLLIFEI